MKMPKDDFLKIISTYDPVEINNIIKSKGKPPKKVNPVIHIGETNNHNKDD